MKTAAIALTTVLVLAISTWALLFGATAPCTALENEARKLVAGKTDPVSQGISRALIEPGTQRSSLECGVLAVRLRLLGRDAITVVNASPPKQGK